MNPILSIHTWCSLPAEVRYKIRSLFSIPQSSSTIVHDGRVETDGTTVEDFKHLTIEKMQEYLKDTSADFHYLFSKTVEKVDNELKGIVTSVVDKPVEKIEVPITPVVKKSKKNA